MKQGLNFILPVKFCIDISDASTIEFIFKQGEIKKEFRYPSEDAAMADEHTINLKWTQEDTYLFEPNKQMYMDTRITMSGTGDQPETRLVSFTMNRTLFEKESAADD